MVTRPFGPARAGRLAAAALALAFAAGCRSEMYDQPKYEPLEASDFFADGQSARHPVPGTVARLSPRSEPRERYYPPSRLGPNATDAKTDEVDAFPFPITAADLTRGQQRYMIFCSPCHGATGVGDGMIVRRGFSPPPPLYGKRASSPTGSRPASIYDDLREAPVGHFYEVITNGHGAMYSYASRIPPEDRWRIAAYIRALQLSQYATADDLKSIPRPNEEEQALLRGASR